MRGTGVTMMARLLLQAEGRFPYDFSVANTSSMDFLERFGDTTHVIRQTGSTVDEADQDFIDDGASLEVKQRRARERVCTALRVHSSKCKLGDGATADHTWVFKEPKLRFLLPVFDQLLGREGFKLVHITRDVRNINNFHYDDRLSEVLAETRGQAARVLAGPGWDKLVRLLPAADGKGHLSQESPRSHAQRVVRFQHVWAHIETAIKRRWGQSWPEGYFHLSELMLLDDGPATARRLAAFVGHRDPNAQLAEKMAQVYKPKPTNNQSVGHLVARLDGMDAVRQALQEFGYTP